MKHSNWTSGTTALAGSDRFSVRVKPLVDNEPMDLVHLTVEGDGLGHSLLLSVPQAEELEQELERARWHRVFRERELAAQRPQLAVVDGAPQETQQAPSRLPGDPDPIPEGES